MVELINAGTEDRPAMVDPRGHPKGVKHVITKPGSHVAKARGYAAGRIIDPGEPVPDGIPVAEEWMVKAEDAADEGVEVLDDPASRVPDAG